MTVPSVTSRYHSRSVTRSCCRYVRYHPLTGGNDGNADPKTANCTVTNPIQPEFALTAVGENAVRCAHPLRNNFKAKKEQLT